MAIENGRYVPREATTYVPDGPVTPAEAQEAMSLALATGFDIRSCLYAVRENARDELFAELERRLHSKEG